MAMSSSRRAQRHHGVRRAMSLSALLLSAAPLASSAFRSSVTTPRAPRRSAGSDRIINTNNNHGQQLTLSKPIRMKKFSSSSTSLNLFGMNKNDNDGKETPTESNIDDEDETTDDEDQNLMAKLPSFLKVAFPSFLAGGVATLAFLFLPLISDYYDAFNGGEGSSGFYGPESTSKIDNSKGNNDNNNNNNGALANNVNQPVILFETILNDLNEAYVDDVDVQKLFETGVKAMTASLDPYTEFESRVEAQELEESVSGKYGGVGLVIRGGSNLVELEAEVDAANVDNVEKIEAAPSSPSSLKNNENPPVAVKDGKKVTDDDGEDVELTAKKRALRKSMDDGIRVVTAFEGYAYDAGMRVGDKLLAIDDFKIKPTTSVEDVRNHLRGDPGTSVSVTFLREGVGNQGEKANEPQTIELKRSVVRIPDVKYFGFIGDPTDGIGYVDLSGFANDAGMQVRFAIRALQHGAEMMAGGDSSASAGMASADPSKLKGLVLDLRSNPGGLLTSAVDVATLFVPNGSDVVSARGRGFPETLYRSKTDPILSPNTRLAVLVNEQTASAAEIVSGAIQDLDVGIIVGKGRTFGKGLVQNVQDLPYQTALKYTVAKYYTPSGRCIQSTVYKEGSSSDGKNAKYTSEKVADKDRAVFYTARGREVKDGGGVEVDYKVEPQKASPLELILLNNGAYSDYAAEWSKNHELTDNFKVDESTYKDFQRFVEKRQSDGDMKLEVLYDSQLKELQKKLKASNFDSSGRELDKLRSDIVKDVKKDFSIHKAEIIEDLEQNILARYLPDSMLIERGLRSDVQVTETAKMLKDGREFDKILPREGFLEENNGALKNAGQSYETTLNKKEGILKPEPTLQSRW